MTRPTIDNKDTLKEVLRQWLGTVRKSTGWSFERIAREADVSPTTLTRFMKPDYPHLLGLDTIRKISAATRIAAPSELGIDLTPSGFGEIELKHWAPAPENQDDTITSTSGVDWWEVRSFLLDLEGLLPGDKIAVDLNKRAQPGDIVMAQVESQGGRDVETVLRKYENPLCLPAAPLSATILARNSWMARASSSWASLYRSAAKCARLRQAPRPVF